MQLVEKTSGKPLAIGQRVKTFRGYEVTLVSMQPPRHPGSEGHVMIRYDGTKFAIEAYASVIGARYQEG
jgi:hypothetical protein